MEEFMNGNHGGVQVRQSWRSSGTAIMEEFRYGNHHWFRDTNLDQ
jgi:hypothetical protein